MMTDKNIEEESLKDEMKNIVEEARMVIPGVQALFGFQTIGIFNDNFEKLPASGVLAHMISLGLLALSVALLMAPAAYHRLAERGQVSRRMITLSSGFITAGMVPLMLALTSDVYELTLLASKDFRISIWSAVATLFVFSSLWFVFPAAMKRKHT
jgi:hypothetical protein